MPARPLSPARCRNLSTPGGQVLVRSFLRSPEHALGIIPNVISVEIVVVGNEVLLGLVQDTNSNYLCRVLTGLGARVRRIVVVGDDIEAIAHEIRGALARRTELILTCGGLGPTVDDLTLSGVARAAKVNLVLDPAARSFVQRRYQELALEGFVVSAQMNQARLKMAEVPDGAQLIENLVGTAPAVSLNIGPSRVVSLPGVPNELKTITEGPLMPILSELTGLGSFREREMIVDCGDESLLTAALGRATVAHPAVYIKSRAKSFGRGNKFRILLSTSAPSVKEADDLLNRAAEDLRRELSEAGISESSSRGDSS